MKLHLCSGCIEDLKEYNPYVDKDGKTIPINELNIEEVGINKCDNYKIGKARTETDEELKCDYCSCSLYDKGGLVYNDDTLGVYCSLEC